MHKNSFIRRFLAGLMLVLFAFSITPKLFLHSIFADHRDTILLKANDGEAQLNKSIFTCDCNDVVATSPFIESEVALEIRPVTFYKTYVLHFPVQINSFTPFFYELRGPPCIG